MLHFESATSQTPRPLSDPTKGSNQNPALPYLLAQLPNYRALTQPATNPLCNLGAAPSQLHQHQLTLCLSSASIFFNLYWIYLDIRYGFMMITISSCHLPDCSCQRLWALAASRSAARCASNLAAMFTWIKALLHSSMQN